MNKMNKIIFAVVFLFCNCAFAQEKATQQAYNLINQNRKINHLSYLEWNQNLATAAQNHANWMALSGKMDHLQDNYPKSFSELKICNHHPVNRIINSGYYPFDKIFLIKYNSDNVHVTQISNINDVWGEIIAHGKVGSDKKYPCRADICVNGWMNSPGHKEQILKPSFREIGIAIKTARNGDVFWCVNFGSRDFILER